MTLTGPYLAASDTVRNYPTWREVSDTMQRSPGYQDCGIISKCAYRHIPGGPINDLWWIHHGIITDAPYPRQETR